MTRKRRPVAVVSVDGGVLVKHTHDVEEATRLAREQIATENGIAIEAVRLSEGRPFWCRILGPLPGSLAEAEGWAWEYRTSSGPGRGVFPAVEFLGG